MSRGVKRSFYDEDYFENGLVTGKSLYQNYRWIPELTIPMAMSIVDHLGMKASATVVDIGCAKGYLVKALRMLRRNAWGVDVSAYALNHVPEDVAVYCTMLESSPGDKTYSWSFCRKFDYAIAKDVLEHVGQEELKVLLRRLDSARLFCVVPLGDGKQNNGKMLDYRSPANNLDQSHVNCFNEDWWTNFLESCGWKTRSFTFRIDGIKEAYYAKYPKAHGFWVLEKIR